MTKAEIIAALEACIDALDDSEYDSYQHQWADRCPWCSSTAQEYHSGRYWIVHSASCQRQRAIELGSAALVAMKEELEEENYQAEEIQRQAERERRESDLRHEEE